jgi:protocatechuate 3,4-dioxygenase alpha subunit
MSLHATPSQTVGPYFSLGMDGLIVSDIAGKAKGARYTIRGKVFDGEGKPVPDAVLEFWQANEDGKYGHPADNRSKPADPAFTGFGRVSTDADGAYSITTIKPGPVPGPGGATQAPHITVTVFMRGMLKQAMSRIYFPADPGNAGDPVLHLVPAERRDTLIAKAVPGHAGVLEWNVVVQGKDETVFFDI